MRYFQYMFTFHLKWHNLLPFFTTKKGNLLFDTFCMKLLIQLSCSLSLALSTSCHPNVVDYDWCCALIQIHWGKVRINSRSKICNSWLQISLGLYKNLYTVPSISSTLVDQNSFFLSYLMKTQAEETKVMEIKISYLHEFIINHTLIFLIHSVPGT